MPKLSDKEVKETLKKYENKHTPRFRIFQLLDNKMEVVIKSTKQIWKVLLGVKGAPSDKGTKEKKETIEIKDEEDALPDVQTIEKLDAK